MYSCLLITLMHTLYNYTVYMTINLLILFLFFHSKSQKWCVAEPDQRLSEIQGFLELSVQRSSCGRDRYKDRLFVYMKGHQTMPLSTSMIGTFYCYLPGYFFT